MSHSDQEWVNHQRAIDRARGMLGLVELVTHDCRPPEPANRDAHLVYTCDVCETFWEWSTGTGWFCEVRRYQVAPAKEAEGGQ